MYEAVDQSARITREVDNPAARRLIALTVAISCASLLTVAMLVSPASAGVGTHEQLALPQCGWITLMDLPCVTCGMTTAFAHTVRGSFIQAALAQPMGFLLAMFTASTFWIALFVALTGSQVHQLFTRFWSPRLLWIIAILTAAAWVYKIAMYRGMIA